MSVYKIINELAADNSRLVKEAILKREIKNVDLINVLKATYDPFINYWVLKIPEYKKLTPSYNLRDALVAIKDLSSRKVTGNAAIDHLANLLSKCDIETAAVIKLVIQRDLKCGISEKTINKIFPGLIPTFDVMLAHKDCSGITYPCIGNIKYDGGRCHLVFDGSSVTAYSRNGKIIDFCGALDESARLLMKEGEVWDGEIVFRKPGTNILLDRKTSNGHFNRGVKGTMTPEIAEGVTFMAWDIVDFSSTIPYEDRAKAYVARWDKLTEKQKHKSNIWVVEPLEIKDEQQATEFYEKCVKHGHEGTILKNKKGVWQPKRTKDLGKAKAEEEADLVVVKWVLGTGRNSKRLGNLVAETSDGKLRVAVGTGFSDEDREQSPDVYLDKIITVKYNQLIKDKNSDTWSMFLPRFIEVRSDKDIANSFGELK